MNTKKKNIKVINASAEHARQLREKCINEIELTRLNIEKNTETLMYASDSACENYDQAIGNLVKSNDSQEAKALCWDTWKVYRDAKSEFERALKEQDKFIALFVAEDARISEDDEFPF
ncbi:MAG: hypothetical protein JW963_09000 [Anaerolineales bacterium]|nr:hypothetical protein [Anaerolineales bacterium]